MRRDYRIPDKVSPAELAQRRQSDVVRLGVKFVDSSLPPIQHLKHLVPVNSQSTRYEKTTRVVSLGRGPIAVITNT